jgi:hypothetical protein
MRELAMAERGAGVFSLSSKRGRSERKDLPQERRRRL